MTRPLSIWCVALGPVLLAAAPGGGCAPTCSELIGLEQTRAETPPGTHIRAATAFAGAAFGVGDRGVILQITNDRVTPMAAGSDADLHAILAGERLLVAGAGGTLLALDGLDWTPITSGVTTDLYALASDPFFIVAAGEDTVLVSRDQGATWTPYGGVVSGSLRTLATFGDSFVAFTATGQLVQIFPQQDNVVAFPVSVGAAVRSALETDQNTLTVVREDGALFTAVRDGGTWDLQAGGETPCGPVGQRYLGDYTLCDDGRLLDIEGAEVERIQQADQVGAAAMNGDDVILFDAEGGLRRLIPSYEAHRCSNEGSNFVG